MKTGAAVRRLAKVLRRKHLALATERSYRAWLRRYCEYLEELPFHLASEQKPERTLSALAKNYVAPATQDQAINLRMFFHADWIQESVREPFPSLCSGETVGLSVQHSSGRFDWL